MHRAVKTCRTWVQVHGPNGSYKKHDRRQTALEAYLLPQNLPLMRDEAVAMQLFLLLSLHHSNFYHKTSNDIPQGDHSGYL